jgi:hypothetical protein
VSFPWFDLMHPTKLVFEWHWLLLTWGNFIVYALLILVFIAGITLRLPGARRDLARVDEADNAPGGES